MAGIRLAKGRIGLLGTYGNGNLGDLATLAAMLDRLKLAAPRTEAIGFSVNPENIRRQCGIACRAISRGHARASVRAAAEARAAAVEPAGLEGSPGGRAALAGAMKKLLPRRVRSAAADLLAFARSIPSEAAFIRQGLDVLGGLDGFIILGGGQILDYWSGPWGHPWTILKWSWMCRWAKVPFLFLDVGASELHSPLSRLFFRGALRNACYRSFRDEASRARARLYGAPEPNHVFPDLAFSLPETGRGTAQRNPDRPLVAVNPMSYRDPRGWPRPEPRIYAAFVRKLADFCAGLVEGGYRVILVTTQSKTDPAASADILARTRTALPPAARQWAQAADPEGVPDLLSILSEADFCVASRFHGVVLSMRLGKPVIALSYEDKTDALMEKAGLAGFNLDIESFSEVTLRAAFDRLVSDQAAIAGSVAAHARENRRRLESQLRTVLGSESRKTIAGRRTKRSG